MSNIKVKDWEEEAFKFLLNPMPSLFISSIALIYISSQLVTIASSINLPGKFLKSAGKTDETQPAGKDKV